MIPLVIIMGYFKLIRLYFLLFGSDPSWEDGDESVGSDCKGNITSVSTINLCTDVKDLCFNTCQRIITYD